MKSAADRPLADPTHPYWTAPRDTWLVARVPTRGVYPCRCSVERRCNPTRCPCAGRTDHLDAMPAICCARRAFESRRRAAEVTADAWISAETEGKEADFAGIVATHMQICKAIRGRFGGPPYLYVDLYAGPGHLEFEGKRFIGSPLVVSEHATRTELPIEALLFEKEARTAARLRSAVDGWPSAHVFNGRCEEGFGDWLDQHGRQPARYGLIYSDPIRDEIPHELLRKAATLLPRVDLLSYVSATQYKRRRGVDPTRPLLAQHIAAVPKKFVLIREPIGAWQWTFVLWSSWEKYPEWRRRGFYRLDSSDGQRVLERLTLTERERRATANAELPFDEPAYATYAEYLRHPRFLAVRAQVFKRANGVCERCSLRPPRDPHHLRYPPWGEFDVPENLIAICHQCHCEIHGKAS